MFKCEMYTDGAAFRDEFTGKENDCSERVEVARILRRIQSEILNGKREGKIFDLNGNKIGNWMM